jgi:hypothetical protein
MKDSFKLYFGLLLFNSDTVVRVVFNEEPHYCIVFPLVAGYNRIRSDVEQDPLVSTIRHYISDSLYISIQNYPTQSCNHQVSSFGPHVVL